MAKDGEQPETSKDVLQKEDEFKKYEKPCPLSRKRKIEEAPVDDFKWAIPLAPAPKPKKKIYNRAALDALELVQVFGDDKYGRRIIVLSCCNMPSPTECPPDKLMKYMMTAIDEYIEMDFVFVFFNHGLENHNCPSLTWCHTINEYLNFKFMKHLKGLYFVHPNKFVKKYWELIKSRNSKKLISKVLFFHHLYHFRNIIEKRCILVPEKVEQYDNSLLKLNQKAEKAAALVVKENKVLLNTTEFGVSLLHIQYKHPRCHRFIPPIMESCIDFLSETKEIRTKNLFRRTVKKEIMRDMQEKCNNGVRLRFRAAHVAASFLKTFLRELEEPLLSFKLFKDVSTFLEWPYQERYDRACSLFLEHLTPEHYLVLKYLIEFLDDVQQESEYNSMDIHNLAVVFGPNLIWPEKEPINVYQLHNVIAFTEFLLENYVNLLLITII